MLLRRILAIFIVLCGLTNIAAGQEENDVKEKDAASVSTFVGTTFYGVGVGASQGLSAGWVRYADRHEMQNVWESVGYGALGGVGLGLTAAVLGNDGSGMKVLKDLDTAGSLGGGFGFVWGIVSALFTGDSRRIASSIAWGNLGGFVLGLGVAGYKMAKHKYADEDENEINYSVRLFESSTGNDCPMVKVEKRF